MTPFVTTQEPRSKYVRLNRYLYMGVSEIRDTLFWGPDNKDPTIQGTILGSPIFANSHIYIYKNFKSFYQQLRSNA